MFLILPLPQNKTIHPMCGPLSFYFHLCFFHLQITTFFFPFLISALPCVIMCLCWTSVVHLRAENALYPHELHPPTPPRRDLIHCAFLHISNILLSVFHPNLCLLLENEVFNNPFHFHFLYFSPLSENGSCSKGCINLSDTF